MIPAGATAVAAEPALRMRGISKAFPATLALDAVSLEVARGEVHALVGHNGSGKSTLVKVLSGVLAPEPGAEVAVDGAPLALGDPGVARLAGCRFVHQDLGLVDALSVADNLSLVDGWATRWGAILRREARERARAALELLAIDVDPETAVGSLSPAARTQVAIARALQPNPRSAAVVLVLDEPTAALPLAEVERLHELIGLVARRGVGVLLISHRLEEVLELSDRVTVLRNGRRITTAQTNSLTHDSLVTAMLGQALETVTAGDAPVLASGQAPLLELDGLAGGLLDGIDLVLHAGSVTGVAGIEGSGREVLLATIFGAQERRKGRVRVAGRDVPAANPAAAMAVGMAFVPADRERLAQLSGLGARENVTVGDLRQLRRFGAVRLGAERREVSGWFDRLQVRPPEALEAPIESFSGGNRQKLVLARALRRRPSVLLLEEPSQGVDVGARAQLHAEILRFAETGGAVLVSSSDPDELARLCHRVVVVQRGRIRRDLAEGELSDASVSRATLTEPEAVVA